MAARLLLLLCVGAVLSWVGAEDAYADLPESYRSGVDLALEQLNSHAGVHHHFRFLRSLEKAEMEVKLRFLLFGVGRVFFILDLKLQIGAVLFNMRSLASSCCLQAR